VGVRTARRWDMSAGGPELLALALSLEADGVGQEEAVTALLESAQCSCTTLMAACAYALSLVRDMPYDAANERPLQLLTDALQRAVRITGEPPSQDNTVLLDQIVEISGRESVAPGAVASRMAELDADVDKLRAAGDGEDEANEAS